MNKNNKGKWLDSIRKNWKLVLAVGIIAWIIASIVMPVIQPVLTKHLENWLNPKKDVGEPDTFIFLLGYNETLPIISNLSGEGSFSVTLIPIKSSNNYEHPKYAWFNLPSSEEIISDNEKLYLLYAMNDGSDISEDIYIKLSVFPNSIKSVVIGNEKRIILVEGGSEDSTFASFKINELMPRERQTITIIVNGKSSIEGITEAWSKNEGTVENVSEYDVILVKN